MGRSRTAMEFIRNEKKRETSYHKKKGTLIKKAHEFSVLCNAPVCIIIYPYKRDRQPLPLPEVYSFKGEDDTQGEASKGHDTSTSTCRVDLVRATDPSMARELIDRCMTYLRADDKKKKSLDMEDMLRERKRKADQELSKLRHKNAMVTISGFNADQLSQLLVHLDHKLEYVTQKIAMIKGSTISQIMVPSNNADLGLHQKGVFNNQLVPFDLNCTFADPCGSCNFPCNINVMAPYYYDQGPRIDHNDPYLSSYSAGVNVPISMPLQYLPMPPNIQLPRFY